MQPKKSRVEWIVAAEAACDKALKQDYLEQNTFVQIVLLKQDFSAIELSPVLEQQVGQTVELTDNYVGSRLQI